MRRLSFVISLLFLGACSIERYAVSRLGDALAKSGTTFASDDDLVLIGEALPFTLKLIESLLAESPRHEGLLLAAASGFTQYAYAFVQQEADEMEAMDLAAANERRSRARRLYLRARDYGLRGLEVRNAGFGSAIRSDPVRAAAGLGADDVALTYWTAAAWGSAIGLSKDDPPLLAELPSVEALADRALALREDFEHGAIHVFLTAYELNRPGGGANRTERSRQHFERAMALSRGRLAAPLVAIAENVSILEQNRVEFEAFLERALEIDPDAEPNSRLLNLVMQRRARWLLSRADDLFIADPEEMDGANEEPRAREPTPRESTEGEFK